MGIQCTLAVMAEIMVGSDLINILGEVACADFSPDATSLTLSQIDAIPSDCNPRFGLKRIGEDFQIEIEVHPECSENINVIDWSVSIYTDAVVKSAFEPRGFGRISNDPFIATFPSVQFTALFLERAGCIYLGVHDQEAFPKRFAFNGNTTISVSYSASGMGFLSLPFTVHVMEGECSWMHVADKYRVFAQGTTWYQKGLARRDQRPDWIHNTPLWVNTHWQEVDVLENKGGDPHVVVERVKELKQLLGDKVPVFLHWYEWDLLGHTDSSYDSCPEESICGFDSHYPDYFPARTGFDEAVKQLSDMGVMAVPYINGRLFDKSLSAWSEDPSVRMSAVQTVGGEFSDETYGNNVHFGVMCPSTDWWQFSLSDFAGKLRQSKVAGVYIDQVAAGDPVPCHNQEHNHPLGGGSSWTSGYNLMMDRVRDSLGEERLVITESNVEQLIGSVDTFLSLVAYQNLDTLVPAFQYIYGNGVFVSAGCEFFESDVTTNGGSPFMRKLTKMFMLGSQLGWLSLGGRKDNQDPPMGMLQVLKDPKDRYLVDAMNRLISQRMDPVISEFFRSGRLAGEVNGNSYVWRGSRGTMIIACNPGEADFGEISVSAIDFLEFDDIIDVNEYANGEWIIVETHVDSRAQSLRIRPGPYTCAIVHIERSEARQSVPEIQYT